MYIRRGYTGGNQTGCRPPKPKIVHNTCWSYKETRNGTDPETFWPIRHELAMINGTVMKGKSIYLLFAETNTEAVAQQPYEH